MMASGWVGLDVGGANLKACDANNGVLEIPFPLWKEPHLLVDRLAGIRLRWPALQGLALTMTGELCDCFPSKVDGVVHIVKSVLTAFSGIRIECWTINGSFCSSKQALTNPIALAAANWVALAEWCARNMGIGPTILIDMGSTTTDLIYLEGGTVHCDGRTDWQRLKTGELVYTGLIRTPVCHLVREGVCAEFFATMLDVHLILGSVNPDFSRYDSADNRTWTVENAHGRLARMLGADLISSSEEQRVKFAATVELAQWELVFRNILKVLNGRIPEKFILAGQGGRWIAKQLNLVPIFPEQQLILLANEWGQKGGQSSCARALALLATHEFGS